MARGRFFNVYFLWTINLPGSVSLLCPSDRRNVLGHSAADTAAADHYGDTLVVLAPLLHSGKFHTEAPHLSFLFQKLPQIITVQRSGFQAVFEPSDVFSEVQMNVKF